LFLGLGIGLYLCKHVVTALGGKLDIKSEFGKGTHVSLELPILVAGFTKSDESVYIDMVLPSSYFRTSK
jgi:K+-sensing histidine kinase KdpD